VSLIRLNDVTLRHDGRPVLREASLRLEAGDRVGIVGRNGSGKSTLLQLALGRLQPDEGVVTVEPGLRLGWFSQFSELDGDLTVVEVLDEVFEHVRGVEAELADLETGIAEAAVDADRMDEMMRLVDRQAELFAEMDRLGGWDRERDVDRALTVLGFDEVHRATPVGQLSGGWRNRAALARIVLEAPDVLLLDEPTNYLDVAGVEWLEQWFRSFRGAALVVSHDRAFLDAVVTRIVEVEANHLHEYPGDWASYVTQKQFRLKSIEQLHAHEAELLAFEAEGIADRREAAKAAGSGGAGRLGRDLARIKKERTPRPADRVVTEIYDGLHVKDVLCRVDGLGIDVGDRTLVDGLDLEVRRGDRVVVTGSNGSGKSTLLSVLEGSRRADRGRADVAAGVKVASYDRTVAELDDTDTVAHAVGAMPDSLALRATKKSVQRFLTLFQFSEADLQKKLGTLSGGQRARVAMAQCLLSGASLLLLDEPTNHLDVASAQVMERALVHFPGAVVVVTHDRAFADAVGTRRVVFGAEGASVGELVVGAA